MSINNYISYSTFINNNVNFFMSAHLLIIMIVISRLITAILVLAVINIYNSYFTFINNNFSYFMSAENNVSYCMSVNSNMCYCTSADDSASY